MRQHTRNAVGFVVLAILMAALFYWNINTGSVHLSLERMLTLLRWGNDGTTEGNILWKIRLSRLLGAALLGGALSIAGFLLQIRTFGEIADDGISHRLRRQRHHHGRVVHHTDLLPHCKGSGIGGGLFIVILPLGAVGDHHFIGLLILCGHQYGLHRAVLIAVDLLYRTIVVEPLRKQCRGSGQCADTEQQHCKQTKERAIGLFHKSLHFSC